jgi:hypothetical protein
MMLFGGGAAEVRSGFFAWYQNPGASGASGLSRARALGVDSSGFIYYGAYIWNSSSGIVMLLMKVNGSTGVVQFARQISAPVATGYIYSRAIAVDSSGNSYIVSAYNNASVAREPGYIVKFNSSGVIQWQRQISDTSVANTTLGNYGVALDSTFANVATIGPSSVSPSGNSNFFVTSRATSTGAVTWQKTLGTKVASGASFDQMYGAGIDSSGNIYTVSSGSEVSGTQNTIVAKWSSAGTLLAQVRLNGTLAPGQAALQGAPAVDASGNVHIVVYDVNRSTINLVKLNSSLVLQWQVYNASVSADFRACCVDSLGNVYTVGYGGSAGVVNVTKFNSSGTPQWTNRFSFTGVPSTDDYCINVQPAGTEKDFYIYPTFSVTTNTPNYYIFGSRVPTSGTKNTFSGSFGAYSIQYQGTTLITASSGSLAVNTTSLANATSTFTDAAGAAVDVAVSPATISQINTYT